MSASSICSGEYCFLDGIFFNMFFFFFFPLLAPSSLFCLMVFSWRRRVFFNAFHVWHIGFLLSGRQFLAHDQRDTAARRVINTGGSYTALRPGKKWPTTRRESGS